MPDDKRRSHEDDVSLNFCKHSDSLASLPPSKRKRSDDSPSYSTPTSSKTRGHIPMSERQQFALLRQMETEETSSEKDRAFATSRKDWGGAGRVLEDSDATFDWSSGHRTVQDSDRLHDSNSHHRDRSSGACYNANKYSLSSFRVKLLQVVRTGDLDSLKQFVKEGIDVNVKDDRGRTVLHELSSRNFSRHVAYLLKHGAQPNVAAANGDTPLHEAARNGCVRVIRTLLRHNADPTISNNRGDRPADLCQDSDTKAALLQHNEMQRGQSSLSSKVSTKPTHRHHYHHNFGSSTERTFGSHHASSRHSDSHGPAATPEICSDSDDTSSTNTNTTPVCTTPLSTTGSAEYPSSLGHQYTPGSSSTGQKNLNPDSLPLSHKCLKKDPYAFEDDEGEVPTEQTTALHPPSSSSALSLAKSTSPTSKPRSLGLAVSTTACVGLPSSESSPCPSLVESSGSLGLIGGPPLRLRFAKEAGQYTLMEHQQNSVLVVGTGNDMLPESQDHQETEPMKDEHSGVIVESTVSAMEIDFQRTAQSDLVDTSAVSCTSDQLSEDGMSQKVPPLRIKFASGTSTDSDSGVAASPCVPTNSPSGQPSDRQSRTEANDATPESGDSRENIMNTSVHSVPGNNNRSRGLDVCGNDGNGDHRSSHAKACNSDPAMVHVDSIPQSVTSANADELSSASALVECSKEVGGLAEDIHRYRSGRTLRSHTAAQREREEKERHTDTTPIKKRKLRTRNEATSEGTANQSSDRVVCSGQSVALTNNNQSVSSTSLPNEESHTVCESSCKVECHSPSNFPTSASCSKNADVGRKTLEDDSKPNNSESPSHKPSVPSSLGLHKTEELSIDEEVGLLACPLGPDDDKRDPQLYMFENPYEKAAALQKKLRGLVNNLVEVHPKAPSAYQQYLLVSRNYLLSDDTPSLVKRIPPPHLDPVLVDLFNEQEEERYAQALKHQSEREHLRLCAEQARLRAQTRAALANLSKPLSFCSVLAYKDLTYVPPAVKNEPGVVKESHTVPRLTFHDSPNIQIQSPLVNLSSSSALSPKAQHPLQCLDEENVRDRFTQRTFIGWLEDIRDTFQQEKKKLLCRQLHEAESLMMVQRLDWEMKLKECHLHDFTADLSRDIPSNHVPIIHVPNDFPLFPNDPVQSGTAS